MSVFPPAGNAPAKNVSEVAGDDVGAVVIDCGTLESRVGYAGDDCPRQVWNSCAGQPTTLTDDMLSKDDLIFPLNFYQIRPNIQVKPLYNIHNTTTRTMDKSVFQLLIQRTCCPPPSCSPSSVSCCLSTTVPSLCVDLTEHPLLLTEPSHHQRMTREKMAEVVFETFGAPAIYIAKQAVLSAFAAGRASGLVVEVGASCLSIVPVFEGYSLQRNIMEFPIGGDLMDEQLRTLLSMRNIRITPAYYNTRKKNQQSICSTTGLADVHESYVFHSQRLVLRNLKEAMCKFAEDEADLIAANAPDPVFASTTSIVPPSALPFYELPDGTRIDPCPALTHRVPEILFNPSLILPALPAQTNFRGLHYAVSDCVDSCDVDIRRDLLSSIILSGGASLIAGLPERLTRALQETGPSSPTGGGGAGLLGGGGGRFKIVAPSGGVERRFSSWIGGSILASLGTFQQMWFSLEEYREHGAHLVERKCA